jgi:hypothetical protein
VSKLFFEEFNSFWITEIANAKCSLVKGFRVYSTKSFSFCLLPYESYSDTHRMLNCYFIFEDLWFAKNTLVKSRIRSIVGLNQKKHARQTQLLTLNNPQADAFFDANHLLGACSYGVKMGLFLNDECFAAMAWSKPRVFVDKQVYYHSYEMVRFATKLNFTINGALSKLFKGFILLKHPSHLMTYTDNDWGNADSFSKLGFIKVGSSQNLNFWVEPNTHQRKYHLAIDEDSSNYIKGFNAGNTKWIADFTI